MNLHFFIYRIVDKDLMLFLNSIPAIKIPQFINCKITIGQKKKKSSLSDHSGAKKLLTRFVIQAGGFCRYLNIE